jgi:C4-dicarboxylate transporter DctQ subunit
MVAIMMRRLLRGLWWFEATVCVITFLIASAMLMADVLGRELLGGGIFGAQRVAVWAVAIAGLVGFALVTAEGGHLRPRFLDSLLPEAIQRHMDRLADLVSAAICIGLGWYAVEFVYGSAMLGERGVAIPIVVWPIQMCLPWMFLSSALRYLAFATWPALKPAPPAGP